MKYLEENLLLEKVSLAIVCNALHRDKSSGHAVHYFLQTNCVVLGQDSQSHDSQAVLCYNCLYRPGSVLLLSLSALLQLQNLLRVILADFMRLLQCCLACLETEVGVDCVWVDALGDFELAVHNEKDPIDAIATLLDELLPPDVRS